MRLGFVGVGRWAGKLAESFRACGAEVVAHDRRASRRSPGFGRLIDAKEIIRDRFVDLLIVTTDCPDTNTELAVRCVEAKLPVIVAKPLRVTASLRERSFCRVDLWRLWDPAYQALAQYVRVNKVRSLSISMLGNGPIRREIGGDEDYGPHALSFLQHLTQGRYQLVEKTWRRHRGARMVFSSPICDRIVVEFGNDAAAPSRAIEADIGHGESLVWEEFGDSEAREFMTVRNSTTFQHLRNHTTWEGEPARAAPNPMIVKKSETLRVFAQRAVDIVESGGGPWDDFTTLEYSIESQRLLEQLAASRERMAAE